MQATHPLLRAPYLPLKAVSPASYTGCCWKKGSLNTCQLIDGVEGASLDRHCCNAPPSRQRALASVLIHPSSPPSCFSASVFKVQRLSHWAVQRPQVFLEWMWQVFFFWCRSASILGPPKESSSTSVNCATQHKRLALQLCLPAYYVFNESLTVFKRNRQVSEWQITPMHRQALDDYHGKLTTG